MHNVCAGNSLCCAVLDMLTYTHRLQRPVHFHALISSALSKSIAAGASRNGLSSADDEPALSAFPACHRALVR